MISLTWYGHSAWRIDFSGTQVLIDPFLSGNPVAPVPADEVSADFIIVTHGHGDHLGDTVAIAKRTGATVIANAEIAGWLQKRGVKTHPQHIGGGFRHSFGYVKLSIAVHGSSLPDGSYGGMPAGVLISAAGKKLYHAGDKNIVSFPGGYFFRYNDHLWCLAALRQRCYDLESAFPVDGTIGDE